jgi:hypothetical protein
MTDTIYIRLSKRGRARANAALGLTLPWTFVLPSVERHASGGVALVTEAQYHAIKHLPGVTRMRRDPWARPQPQQQEMW